MTAHLENNQIILKSGLYLLITPTIDKREKISSTSFKPEIGSLTFGDPSDNEFWKAMTDFPVIIRCGNGQKL